MGKEETRGHGSLMAGIAVLSQERLRLVLGGAGVTLPPPSLGWGLGRRRGVLIGGPPLSAGLLDGRGAVTKGRLGVGLF